MIEPAPAKVLAAKLREAKFGAWELAVQDGYYYMDYKKVDEVIAALESSSNSTTTDALELSEGYRVHYQLLEVLKTRPILVTDLPIAESDVHSKTLQLYALYEMETEGIATSKMVRGGNSLVRRFSVRTEQSTAEGREQAE